MATQQAEAPGISLREKTLRRTWSYTIGLYKFCRKKPLGAFGLFVLVLMGVLAITANWISPHDPTKMSVLNRFQPPLSEGYWLGTDRFGRDMLSRLIHGSRLSLYVGFTAVALGCGAGAVVGVMSGYFRGRFDMIVQRIMDALLAFPLLVLALALVAALGPSTNNVIVAIIVPMIPRMARVVRSVALSIVEADYVTAATAIGASGFRIMLRHMLPNTMAAIIIVATAQLGVAILTEASLGYLGLGTQEPTASWGLMLSGSVSDYAHTAPWIPIIPGIALSLAVFAFNLLGDALRDVLDPRLRQL